MSQRVIGHPTTYGVTVAQAKEQARILTDVEDDLVERHLAAALAYCEHYTSRRFEPQVWEVVLDTFPAHEIRFPGRIVSVSSITYADEAGYQQLVDPATYVVDQVSSPDGWIIPIAGWPTPMVTVNAVRAVATVADGTPPDMQQAIVMLAAHYYADREGAAIPEGVISILKRHIRYYI